MNINKSDAEKALTLARRYIGTAITFLQKADREYAYYKNEAFGDPKDHYINSQKWYAKVREIADKANQVMCYNNIVDDSLSDKLNAIMSKCTDKKNHKFDV